MSQTHKSGIRLNLSTGFNLHYRRRYSHSLASVRASTSNDSAPICIVLTLAIPLIARVKSHRSQPLPRIVRSRSPHAGVQQPYSHVHHSNQDVSSTFFPCSLPLSTFTTSPKSPARFRVQPCAFLLKYSGHVQPWACQLSACHFPARQLLANCTYSTLASAWEGK